MFVCYIRNSDSSPIIGRNMNQDIMMNSIIRAVAQWNTLSGYGFVCLFPAAIIKENIISSNIAKIDICYLPP